jgi:hypothetical protein
MARDLFVVGELEDAPRTLHGDFASPVSRVQRMPRAPIARDHMGAPRTPAHAQGEPFRGAQRTGTLPASACGRDKGAPDRHLHRSEIHSVCATDLNGQKRPNPTCAFAPRAVPAAQAGTGEASLMLGRGTAGTAASADAGARRSSPPWLAWGTSAVATCPATAGTRSPRWRGESFRGEVGLLLSE